MGCRVGQLSPSVVEGVAREMSTGRAVATIFGCTATSTGEAGSGTSSAVGKGSGLTPGHESVRGPRSDQLEAALAAVGEEDETAPKLQEALRKARQQAEIPSVEVRENVSKAQEEVK